MSVEPSACGWCGVPEQEHMQRWTKGAGWHVWSAPTQEQRKERMLARAAERKATTAPDMPMDEFEAADDTDRFEYVRDELSKAKALIDETKALIDEYSAPASGMPHTPAQGADSPLERPETDDYCALCEVPTTTIGGQPWHTGHPKHNEYWSECRGGWRPPKDIKTYTEALVSEMIPAALVTVDPEVQGGEPCMKGTRVQAYLVATLLEDGATWEQVKDIYPSIPVPEASREAAQPGAGDAETSGTGSGRGTGELKAHGSTQAVEEWGVQLNGGSVVPIQGPDARETAEEFRVAFVEQSRHMGRAASAVTVHRVIGPWVPLDEEAGDER